MNLLTFYKIFTGSQSNFLKQYGSDESLRAQAQTYWSQLNGIMLFVFIIMLVIGIAGAYVYYKPFNNRPGRHYKPLYWGLGLVITFFVSGVLTLCLEYFLCAPTIKGSGTLVGMISLGNAIYSGVLYFITSVLWCNLWPIYTNAYPYLKFLK